ncbi:hypothetical protein J2S78_000740 [Salibacterium salarium]|nr:hypothetical protein [Salibacterium salarium]
MLKIILLCIVTFGFITGIINASSSTEYIVWTILATAGILGVLTFGIKLKNIL